MNIPTQSSQHQDIVQVFEAAPEVAGDGHEPAAQRTGQPSTLGVDIEPREKGVRRAGGLM